MASLEETSPYFLSYRSQDQEENRRLDSQHEVIKHAILDGHLIHPCIKLPAERPAIADIACGTGIWLEDVRKTHFSTDSTKDSCPASLVGFDVNEHAFDASIAPAVTLIQHDCTKVFPSEYHEAFDLVNMRGLAYAVPREGFSRLITNAVMLLKPGGYLQWLETEAHLFRFYPTSELFEEAIDTINAERGRRSLVIGMPEFMLQELLQLASGTNHDKAEHAMAILHFALLAGGVTRDQRGKDEVLNSRFSETILESVKLLLTAPLNGASFGRNTREHSGSMSQEESDDIRRLTEGVDSFMKTGEVVAGGYFPFLVAQKGLQ